jgi:hypothetical protein
LTPLKETESVQEILHEEKVEILIRQIKHKFRFAESTMEKLTTRLRQLPSQDLDALFEAILDIKTLKEFNAWLDEHLPEMEQA